MRNNTQNQRTAIYPGSFDPITKGHLDVLERASKMFDRVIIAVLKNSSKKSFLPVEDRVKLIKESTKELTNVEVDSFEGLTIEYAQSKGAHFLIRGLRAVSDFEYELQLCQTNSAIAPDIDTVFLTTKPKYNFISSSIVKELSYFGTDVSKFVPKSVVEYLQKQKKGN
ncbi:TPA: pantetheine-phosphate adenylyltransferase [Candidatus Galligastranaerophilus intestinavium]|uniref:Phosphopantetheine adenylyltransferase n=1 Tax=Candidatus Galligastranaerophilus intestinavium TaxID=2840836 RepID=A0A9D1JXE1_9BACT|nr:pantetheine-phosphate adenylyltransferase [Candidatus Galligastranaerophilus intestinavium]